MFAMAGAQKIVLVVILMSSFGNCDFNCGFNKKLRGYRDEYHPVHGKYKPFEIRTPRVIGGDETRPGEFPWTASIKLNNQPICGGSLISKNWILTAAHCVVGYNPKNLTIRLGAYRIKDMSETQTIDQTISLFIVHKEYSIPRPFSNDIALLKLSEPVDFSDFIIPICLPYEDQTPTTVTSNSISSEISIKDMTNEFDHSSYGNDDYGAIVISTKMSDSDIDQCFYKLEQNYLNSIGLGNLGPQQHQQSFDNTIKQTISPPTSSNEIDEIDDVNLDDVTNYEGLKGTVVGWGWVRELEADDQSVRGFPSVTLQKVDLPILRNSECEAWFQSQSKKITLLPSQFCAGFSSGGKDACRGDSGGPMIIEDNSNSGRYKLIGIVSAGIGCARPSLPGLYTRVASYLPWIEVQTRRF